MTDMPPVRWLQDIQAQKRNAWKRK